MNLLCPEDRQALETHLAAVLARVLRADGLAPLNDVLRAYVLAGGKRLRPQLCVWTWQMCAAEDDESRDSGPGSRAGDENGLGIRGAGVRSGQTQTTRPPAVADSLPETRHPEPGPFPPEPRTPNREPRLRSPETRSPEPDTRLFPALLDLACAWELFHAFLLAHDDIIDGAGARRERPSLHRQLAALDGHSPKFGANLGIVAGDLLFAATMGVLHDLDLPHDAYRGVLRLFSRVACTTGYGQAIDICQSHVDLDAVREETLLREYHWKTAAYTFEGPMLSGAILAGASDGTRGAISAFALAIGQAYQLHNDLLDLDAPAHDGCDLVQGKRTVTLVRARAEMTGAGRREFDARLADVARPGNGSAVAQAERLRRELFATGAPARTAELIRDLLAQAHTATEDPSLPPPFATGLSGLLDTLQARYFVHVR